MQASDADENTYFGAWYHGDMILGGPTAWDTDMTEGQIGINMERANPNDNAFSKFFNIEEVINNDWTPVDFMGWREDRDPDYVFDISAPDRHRFIHN